MKDSLSQDDAVVGEAAGVGMGLVMLGTCSEIAIKDMIEVSNKIMYMYIMYSNVFIYFLSLSLLCCSMLLRHSMKRYKED